jgi:signal transduction histidine kinase
MVMTRWPYSTTVSRVRLFLVKELPEMIPFMSAAGPRIARRDIAIAALFSIVGVAGIGWLQEGPHGESLPGKPVMGSLILLAVIPVLWRRRAPLLAATGTLVGTGVHVLIYGTIGRCGLLLPLLFVEAFAVAAWLERDQALVGLAIVLGAAVVCLSADQAAGWDGLTIAVPVSLAVWFIGRVVRSRTAMVTRLAERNAELGEQRETNARLEVESDRSRLSSELDELLRTRLSELTQLAEAGVREDDDAAPALARIEAESRATLEQMRSVVGLLRDGDEAEMEPQPTLAHLKALLLNAKGAGARLTVIGEPRLLPAGLELSAFRVVEHLLNATADATDVQVEVDFGADTLAVTVSGPALGSRRRTEAALDRARERLALHHGRLESEVIGGRTRARAALPVLVSA